MTGAGSLTQTVATAALAGAAVLGGTNLQAQGPVDAFKLQYTSEYKSSTSDILAAITGAVSVPTRAQNFPALEIVKSDSRWHKYVSERINELQHGEDDFSELSQPTSLVIDRAWQVATRVLHSDTPTPSVVPSDDGNVVFVWHKARWDLEIEVSPEEVTVWAHSRNTGEMFSGTLDEQLERVSRLLDFLAWH
jgi:hypothetical protein